MALLTSRVWAAEPTTVLSLDFSKAEDQAKMTLNGTDTSVAPIFEKGRLTLTNDGSQGNSAFITVPIPAVSDYLATFGMEIAEHPDDANGAGNPPADGVIFLAQTGSPTALGGAGGGCGYVQVSGQRGPQGKKDAADYFGFNYGVDFNTWGDNGLEGQAQTIGLDFGQNRCMIGQTAYTVVGKGLITYSVRVAPGVLTVTANGGTDNLKDKVLLNLNPGTLLTTNTAPMFFGWAAGTGGAREIATVTGLTIQTGLPAPAPTAGQ
jgi:hypothetical protein